MLLYFGQRLRISIFHSEELQPKHARTVITVATSAGAYFTTVKTRKIVPHEGCSQTLARQRIRSQPTRPEVGYIATCQLWQSVCEPTQSRVCTAAPSSLST